LTAFVLSEETARLIRFLAPLAKGEAVDYAQLSTIAGFSVTPRSGKLVSARRILERDHNQVWICVQPNVGLRRLTDIELAERLPQWWLRGARRKLTRGGEQADIVEIGALDIDQQVAFSVDSIQRALAFESLSKATRRRMERVARGTSNDLPAFNAIEWAIMLSPRRRAREEGDSSK
jgi:hypothetical protein